MSPKAKKPAMVIAGPQAVVAEPKRAVRETVAAPDDAMQGYYDQLAALSHENFDAVLKANAALAEGFEAMANEAVGYARQTLTTAGTATKELLEAKTLDRVIEINAGFAKSGLEALVERTARLSELSLALANGTWAPIGGRVEATLAKLTKPVAA
ncbi:MAG: phasin family protein [Alphaproteobacteria bacterium]|nr:phasin family protein [Alphaproteobacteria bacterium]